MRNLTTFTEWAYYSRQVLHGEVAMGKGSDWEKWRETM